MTRIKHSRVGPPVKRFLFRMPASLHDQLMAKSRDEGVSLNQFLLYLAAAGLSNWDPEVLRRKMTAARLKHIVGRANYESDRYQKD